ncbi:hypothetical protein OXX79_003050 [Metschnikowia pulcherrima]
MTVAELSEFMERYEIEYFYRRSEILRGKTTTSDPEPQSSMAGVDIYKCSCAGKPRANKGQAFRNKPSQKCGCRARLTIQFLNDYDHAPYNRLNVREHGCKIVNLLWFTKHNHNFNGLKIFFKAPLSPSAHSLLKILVLQHGITWNQISRMQTKILNSDDPPQPCELMKIKSHHVHYILKQKQSHPFKGIPIVDSFEILATSIRSSQGFAEYTTKFKSLDLSNDLGDTNFRSSKSRRVWSFCFMSAWQKDLFSRNARIIHLDSTHKTCYGLEMDENVYLFTICVKNQITGCGAPAAFMLTNAQRGPVIADFLRKVELFTGTKPAQAVIDCDDAETSALKAVWGPDFPIMYCWFHVIKAFKYQLHLKIKPCANKEDIETEILEEFKQVLASRCEAEARQKMVWFMRNHEAHADLVAYVDKQWFSKKDFIIIGLNARYVQGQNTNNYIESFHAFLKSDSLVGKRCDKRPDVLAHELYTFVAPTFKGKEKKVQLGIDDRRYDKAEVSAESKASGLTIEEVQTMAFLSGEGQVLINSFTDIGTQYVVHLELAGSENDTCTCLVHQNSGSLCKHIFLAKRFWKTRYSTPDSSSETSDSGYSLLPVSNSLEIIRTAARANDTSVSGLLDLTRLEESSESPQDSASLDAECENDISFDFVAAQSTMADAMALDESYSIEANELTRNLLEEINSQRQNEENGQGREEDTNWDRCILSQGPGTQSQQFASSIVDSQTATQTREAEKQHSIRLDDEKLIKEVQRMFRRRLELNSAEKIHNYNGSMCDLIKEGIRDSRNPLATQGY